MGGNATKWRNENKEKSLANARSYNSRPEVREKKRLHSKLWYKRHKDKADSYSNAWRAQLRLKLIQQLGGACKECGISDVIVLDFDHINNDGAKDRKENRTNAVHIVSREPHRFQLLCKNCNWRKEYWRRKNAVRKPQAT